MLNIILLLQKNVYYLLDYSILKLKSNFLVGTSDRPKDPYELCTKRTQEKKNEYLSMNISNEECYSVAKKKLKINKNPSRMQLMEIIVNPDSANRILKVAEKPESVRISPAGALALIIDANLSTKAYRMIRASALKANHDLYPAYYTAFKVLDIYPRARQRPAWRV